VGDLNIAPMFLEILCDEATMAMEWFVLTAQQATIGGYRKL
jgi:hypothetical protein